MEMDKQRQEALGQMLYAARDEDGAQRLAALLDAWPELCCEEMLSRLLVQAVGLF